MSAPAAFLCRNLPCSGVACSVTGVGERIMRHDVARSCARLLQRHPNRSVVDHCVEAVQEVADEPVPNNAGIIAVRMSSSRGARAPAGDRLYAPGFHDPPRRFFHTASPAGTNSQQQR